MSVARNQPKKWILSPTHLPNEKTGLNKELNIFPRVMLLVSTTYMI